MYLRSHAYRIDGQTNPNEFKGWYQYEQLVAWETRAFRAADRLARLYARIEKIPNEARKQKILASLGAANRPGTALASFSWIHRYSKAKGPAKDFRYGSKWSRVTRLWARKDCQCMVECLEDQVKALEKVLDRSGLGNFLTNEEGKLKPGAILGIAAAGVTALGLLIFVGRPPRGGAAVLA